MARVSEATGRVTLAAPGASVTPVSGRRPRLLLVKFGAIGDAVMAIPAAAAMHAAGYDVVWVAGRTVAPVLALYPWIDVLSVDEAALLRGTRAQRLRHLLALWRALRQRAAGEPYDLCATLYYDRRYRLLTLPIRTRRRLSLSWSDRALSLLPGRHHTDEYARLLLGRLDTEKPTHLAPVPASRLPPSPRERLPKLRRIVLVPGGARNLLRDDALRRWPVENYVALAGDLLGAGFEVLLVGGPEDRWTSPYFFKLLQDSPSGQLSDLIGTLSLIETIALLNSADISVTHDTGPLHLAGITASAIIALFGPTDPHGRLPQRAECVALWGGESFACRPCYNGRDYAACTHNGCIREITPAMVLGEVQRLVAARVAGLRLPPLVRTPADLLAAQAARNPYDGANS